MFNAAVDNRKCRGKINWRDLFSAGAEKSKFSKSFFHVISNSAVVISSTGGGLVQYTELGNFSEIFQDLSS